MEDEKKAGKEEEKDITYGKLCRREVWKIGGMEERRKRGIERRKNRRMEDGNNAGQEEEKDIKYGRMGGREIRKI
jgi:hypothetical protein